ncbi:MAG: isoprenylcysteine carboxylmethyltransferase family protein [Acidobacteria bacterium]|nr:isoprenylcysteine carboxylmethyltransferase family protein [Acidobacteriota bacterium]
MSKRMLQRVRVPLGFVFAAVFLYFAKPTVMTLVIGSAVAVVGLAIRAWSSGHIRKAKVLAVSGPYAFTRNPLYVGSLIMGVGFTVAAGVWWLTLLFAVLFIGIYLPVIRVEAEDMLRIFGDEYEEYADNVPMLIPRITPWKSSDVGFDFQLYFQYREYRAALGVAGAIAILAVKALVWPQ